MRWTQWTQEEAMSGNSYLRQTASKPQRAIALQGLLPSVLAVQPHAITLMPPIEAQLWQQQRQKLLSEAVCAAAE